MMTLEQANELYKKGLINTQTYMDVMKSNSNAAAPEAQKMPGNLELLAPEQKSLETKSMDQISQMPSSGPSEGQKIAANALNTMSSAFKNSSSASIPKAPENSIEPQMASLLERRKKGL